ncbi:MAG: hypothetical protein KAX15_02700 [Candidatus Omnitrophica bacterium]|nr:hypothetical protein [Candidatus Omnitrophota bacterium]
MSDHTANENTLVSDAAEVTFEESSKASAEVTELSVEGGEDVLAAAMGTEIAFEGIEEDISAGEIPGPGSIEEIRASFSISILCSIPALPQYPAIPTLMFPVEMTSLFEVSELSYCAGSEQRILTQDEERRAIKLKYRFLSDTEKDLVYGFFVSRKGRTETFYWINPINSLAYIVRFAEDVLNIEYFNYKLYHLNVVDLIEVYWRAS